MFPLFEKPLYLEGNVSLSFQTGQNDKAHFYFYNLGDCFGTKIYLFVMFNSYMCSPWTELKTLSPYRQKYFYRTSVMMNFIILYILATLLTLLSNIEKIQLVTCHSNSFFGSTLKLYESRRYDFSVSIVLWETEVGE